MKTNVPTTSTAPPDDARPMLVLVDRTAAELISDRISVRFGADMSVRMSPAQARTLAAQLQQAADTAAQERGEGA